MAAGSDPAPLIVIVGETASGKSALAMEIAERFGGEIICADSRTVYRGMDIGTAKPSAEDRARMPHHLLDIVEPNEPFSAFEFQRLANGAISDILRRGKLPVLVGGTGLYIDAVLYDFQFGEPADPMRRLSLQKLTVEELQAALRDAGIPLPFNDQNPRHLIRALETKGCISQKGPLRPGTLVVGLQLARAQLQENIQERVNVMVNAGLIDEVHSLMECYGPNAEALQAPGYKAFRKYLRGELSLDEAKAAFMHADLQLAKRQRTWFKRNKSIHWASEQSIAVGLITTFLNK